jgi:hypothetical protein
VLVRSTVDGVVTWRPAPPEGPAATVAGGGVRVGPAFDDMVTAKAVALGVDPRALRTRTLLHLPRIADSAGMVTDDGVAGELERAGEHLRRDQAAAEDLIPHGRFALEDLLFERIPRYKADEVLGRLHYLRSARPGSVNLALLDPVHHLPVSICSISPLQWRRVASRIHKRFEIPQTRVLDVSRVYSCASAPPNAISVLLSRVRRALMHTDYDLLTTSVDTNLGFTGASYRSTNWKHWITVQPRPYLYHNDEYASPRQLQRKFGSSNVAELRVTHPAERFAISEVRLKNSLIFAMRLKGETESVSPEDLRPLHR